MTRRKRNVDRYMRVIRKYALFTARARSVAERIGGDLRLMLGGTADTVLFPVARAFCRGSPTR